MFDSINSIFHPQITFDKIEEIQADFLRQLGTNALRQTSDFLDNLCEHAPDVSGVEGLVPLNVFRTTKYQNPVHLQELGLAATFAVDCLQNYETPVKSLRALEDLKSIPFATVPASSLVGLVTELDLLGEDQPTVPCIFISQNTSQIGWICERTHRSLRGAYTDEQWRDYIRRGEIELPDDEDALSKIALDTLGAFFCDTPANRTVYTLELEGEPLLLSRFLTSFMTAHEYSHIALKHSARLNDESSLAISSVRLRDLTRVVDRMSDDQRLEIPIKSGRVKHFFGYQQQELEADLTAFLALYQGIKKDPASDKLLGTYFRAVCYCVMWNEIHEVIGRTLCHGNEWVNDPLHHTDKSLLSDIAWRDRYPSAYSRLAYLHDRSKIGLDAAHLKVFETELDECFLLFAAWRQIIVRASPGFRTITNEASDAAQALRDSFVWKGLPGSVQEKSISYNGYLEAFRVHRMQDYLERP